ncbi:RHS repeat-associated core domain-containing protein [Luteibacter sp. NPDC031894]|uniref:RHS repeat-associated core domain-containing protein n=1 Tax=Luteibacter sp. NPDC031894 TaxID=3390572 RepID=UPI003D06D8F2
MNESDACVCQSSVTGDTNSGPESTSTSFEIKDARGSLVARYDLTGKKLSHFSYTPYGYRPLDREFANWIGFTGETVDHVAGDYHLGGYRVYDPALGCFQMPDNVSPFDEGGPNAYAYCSGDPVNFADPSGHMEVLQRYSVVTHEPLFFDPVFQATVFGVAGVMLAPFTGGGSFALGAFMTGLAAVSAGFGIAAAALRESDPDLARAFDWASLGTGLASGGAGFFKSAANTGVARLGMRAANARSLTYRLASAGRVASHGDEAAVAANFARSSGPVRLGGHMRDFEHVRSDIYTFVDDYKKGTMNRLNIIAHGANLSTEERLANANTVVALTLGKKNVVGVTADQLLTLLQSKGIQPSSYSHVRMAICYGGHGGDRSFAAQFQKLINVPVKAYKNSVTVNFPSTLMGLKYDSFTATERTLWPQVLAGGSDFRVYKTNPYNFNPTGLKPAEAAAERTRAITYAKNPYAPVYFP